MANAIRGEVSVTANGKAYTLRPGINAICALEELTGKGFVEIARSAEQGRLSAMRALCWAYLQECHGEEIQTLDDAGRWIDDIGLDELIVKLGEVNELNASPKRGRPRKAQPQTGEPSTLRAVGQG